jgi:hypothetical protein
MEDFANISSMAQARDYVDRMWHTVVRAPEPRS